MKINDLSAHFEGKQPVVKIRCECVSPAGIDDLIAWLEIAKDFLEQWKPIQASSEADVEGTK